MISEKVKEYAKREFAVALDMMSDYNERFHAFEFSRLPNGETAYLCLMIVTESEKQNFVDVVMRGDIVDPSSLEPKYIKH